MVTFSKRRSGIYTKLSEISILCGVDVGFLVYSGSGKPYTFGNPSFEAVSKRFLNGEGSSSLSSSIVNAHRKVKIDDLCKTFNNLTNEAEAEEEREKTAAAALVAEMAVESDAWWKVNPKDEGEEKELLGRLEQFYDKLCDAAVARSSGGNDA